jgi:hypothetical protein
VLREDEAVFTEGVATGLGVAAGLAVDVGFLVVAGVEVVCGVDVDVGAALVVGVATGAADVVVSPPTSSQKGRSSSSLAGSH